MMSTKSVLLALLTLGVPITATSADSCPKPTLDSQLNLTIPCVGVKGQQYTVELHYVDKTEGVSYWRLNNVSDSTCTWAVNTCATVDDNLQVTVPNLLWEGTDATLKLDLYHPANAAPTELFWKYLTQAPTKVLRGETDNPGTLLPYHIATPADGTGRKLLAIYMVGSNLESGARQSATNDLFELIGGYRQLTTPQLDIIVAFGGSTKENWSGMKFANIAQLLDDANDARFGNGQDYLYRSDAANMGDVSSLKHFLHYIREAYLNHDQRFLVFWDHGASYRGFGNDEVYNMKFLTLPDIQQALADSGQHFNLLGFDACLMASLETAKYTHQYADYLLASEDLEPGHGWNWTETLKAYANSNDVISMGKAMIDIYVNNSSHPRLSSGKTQSLADLSLFPEVEQALLPVLESLNSELVTSNPTTTTFVANSLRDVRNYSNSYNISLDLKDLLIHLVGLKENPVLQEKVTILLAVLNRYLIYSRHDGSRPYSYGATIDRLDNSPSSVNLNDTLAEVQQTWQTLVTSDQWPPQVGDSNDQVQVTGISNVSAEELTLLRNYIDGGTLSAASLPWWEKAYQIMADGQTTLESKLTAITTLENDSGGMLEGDLIRLYYLNKGVELVRVEIVDVPRVEIVRAKPLTPPKAKPPTAKATLTTRTAVDFIAKPIALADRQGQARTRPTTLLPIEAERRAFTVLPTAVTTRSATALTLNGSVNQFSDDNPIKVTAVYGTLYTNPTTGVPQDFDSFAELEAFPTQTAGNYFTYTWNRMWYTVKYSPDQSSLWLPLRFTGRFWQADSVYTVYTGEMYYRSGESFYPEPATQEEATTVCETSGLVAKKGKCFQRAILELHTDSQNNIIADYVRPYQIVANQTQFDKETTSLRAGDEVWFLFDSFGLEPGATPVRLANTVSAPVSFTQTPEFAVEMMTAVSANTLLPKKFYYAMRATDIAGKTTIGPVFPAQTPMPPCTKLTETEAVLKQVSQALSAPTITPIIFVSPLGNSLDQAASTLMVIAEAEEKQAWLDQVTTFYQALYNKTTINLQTSDWVWGDLVAWPAVKLNVDTILPTLQSVVQRECNLDKTATAK